MRPHEKLDVWNKAIEFVVTVYKVTESFPKEEKFGLTSQIRRASVSIPANIAEGLRASRLKSSHTSCRTLRDRPVKLKPNFSSHIG